MDQAETAVEAENTLVIRRRLQAPREKVFRAWTDPEALRRWFAPSDRFTTPVAQTDPHAGGCYRIEMRSPEGNTHAVIGAYREVKAPERLVFTWRWEQDDARIGETLVTVEFHDLGEATEIVLTHSGFPTAKARDLHETGWSGCIARLPSVFAPGSQRRTDVHIVAQQ